MIFPLRVPGKSTDQVETQHWEVQPEHYIDAWMMQQRSEHATRVEAAEARKRALLQAREKELAEIHQEELKAKLRRREQLNTSLGLGKDEAEMVGKPATKLELMCIQH